jgi:histidine triad (HIT) family protein
MSDCVFCKIINREIPSQIVYEDKDIIAFKDIQPVAPVHVLLVTKTHIESIKDINEDNGNLIISLHLAANKVAQKMGIYDKGYRLINNCGTDAGQTVKHIHYHLIGGKCLGPKII